MYSCHLVHRHYQSGMQPHEVPLQHLTPPNEHPAVRWWHASLPAAGRTAKQCWTPQKSGSAGHCWWPKCPSVLRLPSMPKLATPRTCTYTLLRRWSRTLETAPHHSWDFRSMPPCRPLDSIKLQLQSKLEKSLIVADQSPLSRQQKLKIYHNAICHLLTWLLSLADMPLTWVERTLKPTVMKLLEMWCGISRSADPARIIISKTKGGLDSPQLQAIPRRPRSPSAPCWRQQADSTCRILAKCKHAQDTGTDKKLKPTEEIITTMKEHPNAPRKKLAIETRKMIEGNNKRAHLDHASSLAKESHLFTIKEKGDELWSDSVTTPTEHALSLPCCLCGLSPHNVNLCRWKKLTSDLCPICSEVGQQNKQSWHMCTCHCQAALERGRHNSRYDRVLGILHQHV